MEIPIKDLKKYIKDNFKQRCKIIVKNVSERPWVSDKYLNVDLIVIYIEKKENLIHSAFISKGTLKEIFDENNFEIEEFYKKFDNFISLFKDYQNEKIEIECI